MEVDGEFFGDLEGDFADFGFVEEFAKAAAEVARADRFEFFFCAEAEDDGVLWRVCFKMTAGFGGEFGGFDGIG